jgi:GNAT superfamily N-acetyltransferase
MLKIRQADLTDIPHIAAVKSLVWSDETNDPSRIAASLTLPDHFTTVAFEDDQPAGFADGFPTLDVNGVMRWELNLLAVHPAFRGRGLAPRLIQENIQCGLALNPKTSRALIRVGNIASERSFIRCGYTPENFVSGLYVWSSDDNAPIAAAPHHSHLICVDTLSYKGVWVEGEFSPAGFEAAQSECRTQNGQIAGAIIPLHQTDAVQAAQNAGYKWVENYRFWWLNF